MNSQKLSTVKKTNKQTFIFSITPQRQVAFKGIPRICWWCSPASPLVWQKGSWERTYQNFSTGQHDSCKPSSWINDLGHSVPVAEVRSALTGITAQPKQTDGHVGSGRADEFHCQWQTLSMQNIFSRGESDSRQSQLSSPENCYRVHFRLLGLLFSFVKLAKYYPVYWNQLHGGSNAFPDRAKNLTESECLSRHVMCMKAPSHNLPSFEFPNLYKKEHVP